MLNDSALTVSQLNTYVKMMFESDSRLSRLCIVGEISNFVNHYKTGHCYFSLKDDKSAIKAVMFAANVRNLKFRPENGMRVFVTGRISVFERDGVYQIYVESMEPEGAGALMIALEQLKKKLSAEGLFSEDRKRRLPSFPKKIGVVTSPVGAALHDVINVLSRRYPLAEIVFCPVAVQGVNCAKENTRALQELNKRSDIDVIILGRGGGSVEDLWGYNDELLVREIAASSIPVVTGIGHETDFTLCDYAADMRAPTPSAAAEISVPDINELIQIADSFSFRAENAVESIICNKTDYLNNILYRLSIKDPVVTVDNQIKELMQLVFRYESSVSENLTAHKHNLNLIQEKLRMLNPLYFINKGFVPVYKDDNRIIRTTDIKVNDNISIHLSDGRLCCEVKEIITEN